MSETYSCTGLRSFSYRKVSFKFLVISLLLQLIVFVAFQKRKQIHKHSLSTIDINVQSDVQQATLPQQTQPNIEPPKAKKSNELLINFRAKYHDPKEDNIVLPSIKQISQNKSRHFYANNISTSPTIYGSQQHCAKCTHRKFATISGLFNTGTNAAHQLMNRNCKAAVKFQPKWGKHEIFNDTTIQQFNINGTYNDSLFVVIVKDPLTWIKSMCKANYDFIYLNRSWFLKDCPTDIKNSKFVRIHDKSVFESLIHLWNTWISSVIYNVDGNKWPHIIVRFEDLLFRPKSVVQQVCGCLGECSVKKRRIKIDDGAAKPHGNPRNRTMSFWVYSKPLYRYEGYTEQDLQYIMDNVDHSLLQIFGYEFDVAKTKRLRV